MKLSRVQLAVLVAGVLLVAYLWRANRAPAPRRAEPNLDAEENAAFNEEVNQYSGEGVEYGDDALAPIYPVTGYYTTRSSPHGAEPRGGKGSTGMTGHHDPNLTITQWNAGHTQGADVDNVIRSNPDAVALNELGPGNKSSAAIRGAFRRSGYGIIQNPNLAGTDATPLAYNKRTLTLIRPEFILTSHAQNAGPGAGPNHVKNKWLVGGLFWHKPTRRRVRIFAVHYVASNYTSIRERIALAQSRVIYSRLLRGPVPVFVAGDFNAVPNDNVIAPLYRHGWTNDQRQGHPLPTHGRRAIDYVWWRRGSGVRFLGHRALTTHGDHRVLTARFRL